MQIFGICAVFLTFIIYVANGEENISVSAEKSGTLETTTVKFGSPDVLSTTKPIVTNSLQVTENNTSSPQILDMTTPNHVSTNGDGAKNPDIETKKNVTVSTEKVVVESNHQGTEETQQKKDPLVVEVENGLIKGRQLNTLQGNKTYRAFHGIPYAQPPVGGLRFYPPQPALNWSGILTTENGRHSCIQDVDSSGSEDCLYLDVFTPKVQMTSSSDKEKDDLLPVMVWIYGGYFYKGSSQLHKFGPDYLLDEDVIVVRFNYRLGVFGFLSTEDYAAPGNWGLKDQILALQWVQRNIKNFGGNPKKVTIFGDSAGAACVSYLTQSELAKGLFSGAIMQSGTSLSPWTFSRNPRPAAFLTGKLLDITTTDSWELIKQLRKVEAKTLHAASTSADLGETILHNPLNGLLFAPTIEVPHKGAVVVKKSHELLKSGDFNRVPIMVGFNSQEAIPFVNVIDYLRPYLLTYDIFSTRLVPTDMNIPTNIQKVLTALLIRNKYFGFTPISLSTSNLIQFVTDDQFARPTTEYTELVSKYAPTYFYIFSYQGPLGVQGKKREHPGVGHGEQLHYLWNKEDNIQNIPVSDEVTRQRLVKLFTTFAKTQNPTPYQESVLQNVTWPQANIRGLLYLDIGKDLKLGSDFERYNIPFWKTLYQREGKGPFDTY